MRKRPLPVTIVAWLLIVAGVLNFAFHFAPILPPHPFQPENLWILLLELLAIVFGAFMLRGRNWARWLALAWVAFHVYVAFLHSLSEALIHALIFLLIAYVLFRPESRAWFRPRPTP